MTIRTGMRTMSGVGILILASSVFFGVKWGDATGLVVLILAAVFGATGWGMLITALARTPAQVGSTGSAIMLIFVCGAAAIFKVPPAGYKPAGWNPPAPAPGAQVIKTNYTPDEIIKTGSFWVLWLTYFIGAAAGLMIIGQAVPIGVEVAKLDKAVAATGLGTMALLNGLELAGGKEVHLAEQREAAGDDFGPALELADRVGLLERGQGLLRIAGVTLFQRAFAL